MMARPAPFVAAERHWVEALEKVRGFTLGSEGAVVLRAEDGARLELVP